MKADWIVTVGMCGLVLLIRYAWSDLQLAGAKVRVARWAKFNGILVNFEAVKFELTGTLYAKVDVQGKDREGVTRRYTLRVSHKFAFNSLLDMPVVVGSRVVDKAPPRR